MDVKISRTVAALIFGFLFLGMVLYNLRPMQALDLGWHLASGRYMVMHHAIPHTDVFSFTCFGRPWVDSYWLQEAILFLIYSAGGITGLIVLKAHFVAVLVSLMAWARLRHHSVWIQSLAALWLFAGAAPRGYGWSEQASLITLLFLGILFVVLEAHNYELTTLKMWPLAFFFGIWANMHRGFILGLVLLAFCIVTHWPAEKINRYKGLKLFLLCLSATCVTPWGFHLFHMIGDDMRLAPANIAGWSRPPWKHLELFWFTLSLFIVTWVVKILRKQMRAGDATRLLISALLSWNASRYVSQIPYFMLWAIPFVIKEIGSSFSRTSETKAVRRALSIFVFAAAIFLCIVNRPAFRFNRHVFPVDACEFIARQKSGAHFFQEYAFGGYWLWRLGPERPDFIDGRYPAVQGYAALYDDIERARNGPPQQWQTFLDRYHVEGALVRGDPAKTPLAQPFAPYFPSQTWALVYYDRMAYVFLKRLPVNAATIAAHEVRI